MRSESSESRAESSESRAAELQRENEELRADCGRLLQINERRTQDVGGAFDGAIDGLVEERDTAQAMLASLGKEAVEECRKWAKHHADKPERVEYWQQRERDFLAIVPDADWATIKQERDESLAGLALAGEALFDLWHEVTTMPGCPGDLGEIQEKFGASVPAILNSTVNSPSLSTLRARIRGEALEEAAKLIDDPEWTKPDRGEEWWVCDYQAAQMQKSAAAIRRLLAQPAEGELTERTKARFTPGSTVHEDIAELQQPAEGEGVML